jgi:methionyl-tRNA synthetase
LIRDLVYLIRDLAVLVQPYLPVSSEAILGYLGLTRAGWADLGRLEGIGAVRQPELLFRRLEDEEIEGHRARFGGQSPKPAQAQGESKEVSMANPELRARFRDKVELRVARVTEVERHPKADKLFIESVDLGTEQRKIVSGLVGYYTEDQLKGRNVVMVTNLKVARLRGVDSQGMLLAAQDGTQVEVLFADHARPGDPVTLEGEGPEPASPRGEIDIEQFFKVPIQVQDHRILVEGAALACAGRPLLTTLVKDGQVK